MARDGTESCNLELFYPFLLSPLVAQLPPLLLLWPWAHPPCRHGCWWGRSWWGSRRRTRRGEKPSSRRPALSFGPLTPLPPSPSRPLCPTLAPRPHRSPWKCWRYVCLWGRSLGVLCYINTDYDFNGDDIIIYLLWNALVRFKGAVCNFKKCY